jgi:NhaC family Na+:H+ antiporter
MSKETKEASVGLALIPVIFLVLALFVTIVLLKQSAHIPLVMATAVAAAVAVALRYPWKQIQEGMVQGINLAMGAILILMVVGTMIGTWISGGIVPAMIFYGLKVLSPGIFLAATMLICSVVSLGTGSSWSTAGTVGVALIGVGQGLGIPAPVVAGAIISGAYFGDKMSPLSDTTNLAPAVAGTDLFSHIRHMIYTVAPAYIIALGIYSFMGAKFAGGALDKQNIDLMLSTMQSHFFIHPLLLLPPIFVIVMVILKIPPLPSLLGGTVLGGIFAMLTQSRSLGEVIAAAHLGHISETGVAMVDELLTRGGLMNMMETVALIICALSFGGIMERTGMLKVLAGSLLRYVKRTGTLVMTTVFSCIGMNVIAADQYIAIVVPGRMFKSAFDAKKLHPKNLSRVLENSGTMTSPLIPWNSCGAFMGATLGVNPLLYLPYAFLNLMVPVVSIFYGYTGITMEKVEDASE